MATLKGRNAHKGRTFGGVAACPHCSAPIRLYVTAARTQCVIDVVDYSYLVPPYPADPGVAVAHALRVQDAVGATDVSSAGPTVVGRAEGPVADASVGAALIAHPGERGFDDDEAPSPQASEMDLFR